MKKYFILKVNQEGLARIVRHLNKGVYEEVAELLADLQIQVQKQLPKPKQPKLPLSVQTTDSTPKPNGASRYAKAP